MAIPQLSPTPPDPATPLTPAAPVMPVTAIVPVNPTAAWPHETRAESEAASLEPGLQALNRLRADWAIDLRGRLAQYLTEAEQGPSANLAAKARAGRVEEDTLSQPLETLLLRVLSQPGGEKRLLADLRHLPHLAALTLLTAGLDAASKPRRDGSEHAKAPLLRQLLRSLHDQDPMPRPSGLPQTSAPPFSPDHYPQAAEKARLASGWARILDRQSAGDIQAGSAGASGWAPAPGTPLLRLQLWDGRRAFEMLAPEAPPPGSLARFVFSEAGGPQGGEQGRLLDYAGPAGRPMPGTAAAEPGRDAEIQAVYAEASPLGRRALAMTQDILGDFADAPWFAGALRDGARVLRDSGWFGESASPERSEAESLLRLWLAAPLPPASRAAPASRQFAPSPYGWEAGKIEAPGMPEKLEKGEQEETSRILSWAQTLRHPQKALPGLNLFRPIPAQGEPAAMPMAWLRADTRLWPADDALRERLAALLGQGQLAASPDAGAGRGTKGLSTHPTFPGLTPQGATLEEWAQIVSSSSAGESKDAALRSLLHGLVPLAPMLRQDIQPQADGSMTLFWFQGAQWQSAHVHPDPGHKQADPERKGSGRAWMATVGWQGEALGEAEAEVKLTEAKVAMEVSNEGLFAQAALAAEIPRLEAALAQQGLTLQSWYYRHIAPEAAVAGPPPGEEASALRVPRPPHIFDARV